jgi:hypothetical protein
LRVELELRNLPRDQVVGYLIEAGGLPTGELAVSGEGWSAWLEEMPPAQVGSLSVPRDRLIFEGQEGAVEAALATVRPKTMRGGG